MASLSTVIGCTHMGPGLKSSSGKLFPAASYFKRRTTTSIPKCRRMDSPKSSLTLANMGQGKGLRRLLPVPTSESLGSGSGLPAWHCATWGEWCIFHEVIRSLGQTLGSSNFLEPDSLVPTELPPSLPGCQAPLRCSHEPSLLESLQVQSAADSGWRI